MIFFVLGIDKKIKVLGKDDFLAKTANNLKITDSMETALGGLFCCSPKVGSSARLKKSKSWTQPKNNYLFHALSNTYISAITGRNSVKAETVVSDAAKSKKN